MKTKWFRYAMETDEGGGGGADVAVEEEPGFQSAFSKEGWKGDAPPVADPPAPAVEPDGTVEPPGPDATPAEKAEWEKQFPGGVEELWKGYNELRTKMSRGEHLAPPAEEPKTEEPANWRTHKYESLGAIPIDGLSQMQRVHLGELMQDDAKAAATWASANSHLLTQEEFAAVQSNWYQADPYGATQAWEAARQNAERERQQEEMGPVVSHVEAQRQQEGMRLAGETLPIFEQNRAEFGAWLAENPQLDDHLSQITDPATLSNALITVFYQWHAPYMLQKAADDAAAADAAAQAAEEEAKVAAENAEKANRRGRTITTSAPAPPAGGEASSDDIRSAIMGAARGTVPARK